MPFAAADQPSIQVGLLTAIAQAAGYPADAYHFNVDLAAELAPDVYDQFCEHRGRMTGEWLFSPSLSDPGGCRDELSYFDAFPAELEWVRSFGKSAEFLTDLRRRVLPAFVESCLKSVDWDQYRVVGFSSTFQQNLASLALARRIKQRHPEVAIVFGGANMEAQMGHEYARAFPFVDYVVSGEADQAFPALLHRLAGHPSAVPDSVIGGNGELGARDPAVPVTDLDALPVPDYRAYFERVEQRGLLARFRSGWMLPFESSRGCWWGQKHHCTFCGLNGQTIAYRSKSPARVLDELSDLARLYEISFFQAVDNILDLTYLTTFFAEIERDKSDHRFFWEVKANLTRAQIKVLFNGGVRRVQPGIESMSTAVLALMRKGCTMLQNVRCLKWCRYYGIRVAWNLIWGFPGETRADYERELEVLRSIGHLEPAVSTGRIWLERFSPYFTERDRFPVRNVRPEASYAHVYPEHVDLDAAAYFFEYDMGDTVPAQAHEPTRAYLHEWQQTWRSENRHTLTYRRVGDSVFVDYRWGPERHGTYTLSGALAAMYEYCGETIRTADQVTAHLREAPAAYDYAVAEVRDALDAFCRGRLMLEEDGKYLALALPSNPNW